MSINGDASSHVGFNDIEHQAAYVYAPTGILDDAPEPPTKRRKINKTRKSAPEIQKDNGGFELESLLNGAETPTNTNLRQKLFGRFWASTEERIQSILSEANEGTLVDVVSFVGQEVLAEGLDRVPTAFIVTGPNIASQGLLFKQLSSRLKTKVSGPVVTLRSGDVSNLKAALKKIIRDATSQKLSIYEDEDDLQETDGRKLLNYDLKILHDYVNTHGSRKVIVALEDSEAFDTSLLAELIFSWLDRIPFVLLFGIATSVDLFHERLSRAATRCLYGPQFDVEQTSSILERIFLKVIAGAAAPLRLGPGLISSLIERQHDHVQSVQAFIGALKYAYMCHFYANPLSVLLDANITFKPQSETLQLEHFEAVRNLPSFRRLVEELLDRHEVKKALDLFDDNELLLREIQISLKAKDVGVSKILQAMHILSCCAVGSIGKIDLYTIVSSNDLRNSTLLISVLDTIRRMDPDNLINFIKSIQEAIKNGNPELALETWVDEESTFSEEIQDIKTQTIALIEKSAKDGITIRSGHTIHNKTIRATVIAHKVQLSQEKSSLTKQDLDFTTLIDQLISAIERYVTFENPQHLFLNEVWLYDSKLPYRDVFTPRPKFAIERALSVPHDYLGCQCCNPSIEGSSLSHPPTAILYQCYLDAGSLINVFDLWTAFLATVGKEEDDASDERQTLMLFYRALADLKSLGMLKQSRKKTDHLAKLAWKGL
ncbi:hypothetical protein B7494_g5143 [Chlorociboria aeruginascens]|nr:hypothetical protein B7494_g5143 [Chlorociboria aeruginascens]